MKITSTNLLLGAAGLLLAHTAGAQTIIRIAGSNGDRNATNAAIEALLDGETAVRIQVSGVAGTATTSNFNNYVGGTFSGTPVTVKTAYIGATGGIKAVAGSETVRFLPTGATGTSNPNPLTSTNAAEYEEAVPNWGVSTNFQETSPYNGTYLGKTYKRLTAILTGVVPLNFVASPGFPGDNITTAAAQALWSRGSIPLAFLTGLPADRSKTVFAVGRNTDAGQRYGHLAEIGLGVNATAKHFQPTISGGVATSHIFWPVETISGVSSREPGNGGYNSGADLRAALVVTLGPNAYKLGNPDATAGYYIGYLTPSDANTIAPSQGAKILKWNGVTYSAQAVQEGQYTAWLYTRVIYDPAITGVPRQFADAIATQVKNVNGSTGGGILIGTMQVERLVESGDISAKYF